MTTVLSVSRGAKRQGPALKSLPALTAPILRLNGLAPYYTMFPLSFPFRALSRTTGNEWVLDPFCGRGTTILAARLRGLPSVGVDSNPVAGAIASAKLVQVRPSEIISLANEILENRRSGPVEDTPRGDFWELCYAPATLRDICRIRNRLLESCTTRIEVALRGLMLGILHGPLMKSLPTYLSNQMPRTYSTKPTSAIRYWRNKAMLPPNIVVADAIARRAKYSFMEVPPSTKGKVVQGDSRYFDFNSLNVRFSWVVTSPPYYGMRTYFPDHWLRNWFVGGPNDVEYKSDDQLCHDGEDKFVADLATVWKNVANVCIPRAKLVCRFGALPSCNNNPRELLRTSLEESGSRWRITTIRDAGTSHLGKRQCYQFGRGNRAPLDEIDVHAVLET